MARVRVGGGGGGDTEELMRWHQAPRDTSESTLAVGKGRKGVGTSQEVGTAGAEQAGARERRNERLGSQSRRG